MNIERMKRRIWITAVSLLAFLGVQAQDLGQVRDLYSAGMYAEAYARLEGCEGPLAEGYRTLCALQMHTAHSLDLAEAYLETWPESVLATSVRFQYALDLFDRQLYEPALQAFSQTAQDELPPARVPEYTYKLGYSAYGVGEWERAKTILHRMEALPYSDYTAPAHYTLGYICYLQGNFAEASDWFLQASKDHRFEALANYYILECRFNQKDYAYVVRFGESLFNKVPEDRQPHMARLMSESYLVLGDVAKARSYYEKNLREKPNRTRADYFYAGEVHYLVDDWQGAVDNFSQMKDLTDSLGQIASYQMGYSYIQLHNKVAAMDAFKQAAGLPFSEEIQEDAFYNYAKLAFDLGNDRQPFEDYLHRYDTRAKGDQIYAYMAMAALQSHDYEAAVDAYDHIDELDPKMQSNYMKAYFLRARELMEAGAWRSAEPHLKAAAYYSPRRDGFNQLARYYLAEACYRDGKYADARTILNDLYNLSALHNREEGKLISYQMAYTYFKEADYSRALRWFQNYLEGGAGVCASDAQTRVADCYFFGGDYATAVAAYERQMTLYPDPDNLYPAYRAGVASGLMGDEVRKVHFLESAKLASPSAPYYSESLYELGRAYVAVRDPEDAIRTFRTLKSASTDPSMVARALLELGTIARNQGDSDGALNYYKQVVALDGPLMEDALLAIETVYRTRQDPQAYLAYVNSLGDKAHRTDAQKEEVFFSSAEQIYLSGDYAKAQQTLDEYLRLYPFAAYRAKACFYLADCYRASGALEQAADQYQAALDAGLDGALAETALLQFARLHESMGSYGKAFGAYLSLRASARLKEYRDEALVGLMRTAFRARQWEDAGQYAGEILETAQATDPLYREALYVRAKSRLSSSRRDAALADFRILAEQPSTAEGAEAAYLLIQDKFDRGEFQGIQEQVYSFAEKAGGQNYWLAKAFIVLGDTFAEQGNMTQARATFESIRSGYTPSGTSDDVLDQVDIRLRKLNK